MTIIRWTPFRELTSLQQDMDRWLNHVHEKWENSNADFIPAAEILNTNSHIYLNVEIPGVAPADIDVQVTGQTVSIVGERHPTKTEESVGSVRSELRYGKFNRVIVLPEKIQNDQVVAKYENGLLKLVLPKLVEEQNAIVKVEIAA
jgi:HSP20 family protein